ncbi:MAG: hypothetical protein HXK96_02720, partial [Candidatus Nanogingivalaceae bacterium]|nr:hypothetical protein [Candidatus Nanogingivalaceae bacterium]
MISRSKTLIIAAAAVLSVVGFKSALAAPQDVTNQIKVTPTQIKSDGREWTIEVSGVTAHEGDWATFRAENVSLIPGGKADLKYNNDKIGEVIVDKYFNKGQNLNFETVPRDDEDAKPAANIWQGKIVFNKNIEKYTNFRTTVSNNNANNFILVNHDVVIETKIIGTTTLKGDPVTVRKPNLLVANNTNLGSGYISFNTNDGSSVFGPTIIQSKNNPVKAGTKLKLTMSNDSPVRFDSKNYPAGTNIQLGRMRESISASTPVNKYGVYFSGGPSMDVKIISTSDTEIVIEVTKDMPAMDGIYRNWVSEVKVVDGSKIANGKINDIKYTSELIAPDGNTIAKSEFNQQGGIFGSNVETYARIKPVKPAEPVKPKDPENKPAVVEPAEPAKEDPKKEDAPKEIKAPNTGFEKVANVLA